MKKSKVYGRNKKVYVVVGHFSKEILVFRTIRGVSDWCDIDYKQLCYRLNKESKHPGMVFSITRCLIRH